MKTNISISSLIYANYNLNKCSDLDYLLDGRQ